MHLSPLLGCKGGSRAQTPSPQPAASPPFCSGGLGPTSRVPCPSGERESQSVWLRETEREEESWAWSEPKGRPTRYTFNTGDIRVCPSHASCIPPHCLCIPTTARCLPSPPLGKERATANCPPANCPGIFAERSTLTRHYYKARSEPLHYHCVVVHTTPASSDKTTRSDCTRCSRQPSLHLHLGKHLTTWRIDALIWKEEPLAPASKPLARLNYHLCDLLH